MQASDYHHFADQRDQILKCSGMYGVLLKSEEYYTDLLNLENKIVSRKVKIPHGLVQLFIEAMSNASDHVRRVRNKIKEEKISRIKNTIYDVNIIEVEVSKDTFTITNYGLPIPIERHKNGKWIPELIFGNLNSSSNYFGVRTGAGVNGYGAKLGNLFSEEYIVQIINRLMKKSYLQVWSDRMGNVEEPLIEEINSKGLSSVTVSAKIKLEIFGMKEFSDDVIDLFKKITLDTSFSTKIGVSFNGEAFNVSKPEEYLKLYSSSDFISHEMKVNEQNIEAVYFDCLDNKIVSFVNSQITSQHGTHVDTCINALTDYISAINKKFKKEDVSINKKILKNNISLIVNFSSTDVQMNSQSKNLFQDKVFQFKLPESKLKKMEKWNLTNYFNELLNSKITKKISKTDGKNSSNIKIAKARDALYAGRRTKEMDKMTPRRLCIDEGNSADNFAHAYFDTLKKGRHYNGSLPLRGKIINPDGKSEIRVSDNQQIQMIKKLLGLKEGVDYSDDKNFKTLRYDQLVILTDEDYDGHHICGLILNIFERKFPSLLKRNDFILKLKTPLVIAEKKGRKKEAKVFFRSSELEEWKSRLSESEIKSWSFKYNKGLASIEVNEIKEYGNTFKMIQLTHDDSANDKLNMFFDKKQVNERKEWLSIDNSKNRSEEVDNKQLISNFIDNELKDFSYHSIERGIPQLIDGLKVSQRQIIWTVFGKWTRKQIQTTNTVVQKELSRKVSQFSSEVSLFVDYHHGDDSLNKAISRMAQSFVNSNNLPFF
jgi:DNA topoisomerase-2